MTLERHRSSLIPTINFSGDGTLIVTNPDGSSEGVFPIVGTSKSLHRRTLERNVFDAPATERRSASQRNDSNNNRPRYKQRSSLSRGSVTSIDPQLLVSGGTVSTASSSLVRRLRHNKATRSPSSANEKWSTFSSSQSLSIDSAKSKKRNGGKKRPDTWSSPGRFTFSKKKRRDMVQRAASTPHGRFTGGKPRLTPEIAASLNIELRSSGSGSNSTSSLAGGSRGRRSKNPVRGNVSVFQGGCLNLVDSPQRRRRFTDEILPYAIFLIVGSLLIIVGILRLLICVWHEFGNGIWAGSPILCLGIVGWFHQRKYSDVVLNSLYILFGILSSIGVMIASAFTLSVLVPTIYQLLTSDVQSVYAAVSFSNNNNHTLPELNIPNEVTLTLVLDFMTLLLLAVGFYSQTATVIAIDNYWNTNYDLTSDCDHRGNPRFFNPLEQMTVGQMAIFVGIVEMTMIDYISKDPGQNGWTMVWDGVVIIFAAFMSMCFGKRVDRKLMGVVAIICELLALLSCTLACIFTTVAISSVALESNQKPPTVNKVELISLVFIESIYNLVMVVNIVFIVGIVFRQCQQVCSCCTPFKSQQRRFGRPVNDYTL